MSDLHVVILAAGKGTRMKSALPKVLHRVGGRPMIDHVLAATAILEPRTTTVVVGHEADTLTDRLAAHKYLTIVVQEPQLGTGHALLATEHVYRRASGILLLLSGDVPLLSPNTLKKLVNHHVAHAAALTVLTAVLPSALGYGRVVRTGERIARIVEETDVSPTEQEIREINSGIYAFALDGLFDALHGIATSNAQREYYLPDLVSIYSEAGRRVETVTADNADEIRGINTRLDLEEVNHIVNTNKNEQLMRSGVTIRDRATAYIDPEVQIGQDTIIHPGVSIEGRTTIGASCEIHSGVRIVNSHLGDRVVIHNHCVISDATIADEARIGPFAHLRKHADIRERARVGNFVELKQTVLGAGSKSMHLAYLGDATIGEKVNIGAGTITCNYDGDRKSQTTIEDGAFIGSDTQLLAPVRVGQGAYVGSGTTVRENVPAGALAVSAGKQRNIEGWVQKKRRASGPAKR